MQEKKIKKIEISAKNINKNDLEEFLIMELAKENLHLEEQLKNEKKIALIWWISSVILLIVIGIIVNL